jgi:hypothetical protein
MRQRNTQPNLVGSLPVHGKDFVLPFQFGCEPVLDLQLANIIVGLL